MTANPGALIDLVLLAFAVLGVFTAVGTTIVLLSCGACYLRDWSRRRASRRLAPPAPPSSGTRPGAGPPPLQSPEEHARIHARSNGDLAGIRSYGGTD